MNARAKVQNILMVALLFPVIHASEGLAQETDPSSETVTLVEKVQIPVEVNDKEVGKTSLPAGTKVTVVSRDGARVSIKRGNLGPVWVEASQLSGLSDKKPEQPSTPVKTDPAIELQKLNRLVSENKWAQVAAVCETIAQADEKFSGLAELAEQLKSALQAQASAVQQQKKAETEAKRLRRNADVVGQPNRLNPSDRSPMERAQKLRDEADSVIEEAKTAFDASEAQIAQVGTEVSSQLSQHRQRASGNTATAKSVSNSSTKDAEGSDAEAEANKKSKIQSALLVLDWPVKTHTHEEAVRDIMESMERQILPKLGMNLEDCVKSCPIDRKETFEYNLRIQENLLTQLGKGWTKSAFRCGDIIAVVAFDPSGTAADVRYSHMDKALNCSDDGLLNALCRYNEPSAEWVRFEPDGQMNGGMAMGDNPDTPVAIMMAEISQVYVSTPRAQSFWNAKKASRSTASTLSTEQPTKQVPSTDAQPDRKRTSRNNQKTAPDDKFGKLGVMRTAGVFSVENYQQSANERLEAFASGATPQIGMDYQTCVERFSVADFKNNTEQRDARYSEWVVTLDEGWTRALFRVGDLFADILFSPEQKAEFISLEHINRSPVFVLSEEPLTLLCRGIAPGYEWSLEVADRRTKSNELRWEGMGTRDQAEDVWVAATEKVLIAHTSRAHDFVHKYRDALDQGKQPNSD